MLKDEYAPTFCLFHNLTILHLHCQSQRRPQPNLLSDKDFQFQSELWASSVRSVALSIPTLDFVGWHGEHYVILRGGLAGEKVELKELPARRRLDCGKGVDLGNEDATWLERKDVPMDYEVPGLEA